MPPRREAVEEALVRLKAIRDPWSDEARTVLTDALAQGQSVVVQSAASIIADGELHEHEAGLIDAFDRLSEAGGRGDAGCRGKVEIVRTLARLNVKADDVYLRASRHVQMEYSGDTGAPLRAQGIVAMAETGHPRVLEETVRLLFDKELGARLGAVQALLADGSRAAQLLLRATVMRGDDSELILNCLLGLLEADRSSIDFVASRLAVDTDAAAMALGTSRRPEAFGYLKTALDRAIEREVQEETQAILMGLTMLRSDESLDYLLGLLNGRDMDVAVLAYGTLQIYREDPEIATRLDKAVKGSKYRRLFTAPRRSWTAQD